MRRFFRTSFLLLLTVVVIGLPVLASPRGSWGGDGTVSAAPAVWPAQDRHPKDKNQNRNDNGNRNSNGNDNRNSNDNDNSNENQHPRGRGPVGPPPPPPAPPGVASRCYTAGEAGALSLTLPGGTVTLTVVSNSTFPRTSQITLAKIDPATVPATPGARLDDIVFELRAQDGCDGSGLGELPADANLGVSYTVSANAPKLTFAIWDGSRWTDVPTAPDPSNQYISATVRRTGTYAVYQRP